MKLTKKFSFILGLIIAMGLLSSCNFTTRQKIESGLKEPFSVYPTKNLEDFYDKEGYRDSNFSKDDKGVWSVISAVSYTHLTLPTTSIECRSRWSPYH